MVAEALENEPNPQLNLNKSLYLDFPCSSTENVRGEKPLLNRYSSVVTKGHDFPGAQVLILQFCLKARLQADHLLRLCYMLLECQIGRLCEPVPRLE